MTTIRIYFFILGGLQLALALVLVEQGIDFARSVHMLDVVHIILAFRPSNVRRHQAALGVEGQFVTLREALTQGATTIHSQVDTVNVRSCRRQQEHDTGSNLSLSSIASAWALQSTRTGG